MTITKQKKNEIVTQNKNE